MEKRYGFFQTESGNNSMMRLLAFMGFCLGGGVAVPALIGALLQISGLVPIVVAGLTLAGGGEALKMIQRRYESKT